MRLLALKRVLTAIDLDGSSEAAWSSARDLATAAGSEIHVLHVAGSNAEPASTERELERMGISRDNAQLHLATGDPARAINLIADRVGADVIVLGPHRERPDHAPSPSLGSTALAVVTNAAVPCLVTAAPLRLPLGHVVAGVDVSDSARGTMLVALSWASALRSRDARATSLTALHIMDARSDATTDARARAIDDMLTPIREAAGEWAGVTLRVEAVRANSPAEGIATYVQAHSAGLVALGTRGLGLEPTGRLGSAAADVMRRIDLPILLVPPAMWKHARNAAA